MFKRGVLVLVLLLFTFSTFANGPGYNDLQNPQKKIAYLQKNFGVQILSNVDNVRVVKDALGNEFVGISNTFFNYRGATIAGGTIVLDKNGDIVSAEHVLASSPLQHKGVLMAGTFSLKGKTLTMEKGTMILGDDAKDFKIKAMKGTSLTVNDGKGYTGDISAVNGPFKIKHKSGHVTIDGNVKVVNGKILSGEGIEALTPVKGLFANIDGEVSFSKGNVNGKTIRAKEFCLNKHCFSSKKTSTFTVTEKIPPILKDVAFDAYEKRNNPREKYESPLGITIRGKNVKYRHDGNLEAIINSKSGVTFETTSKEMFLRRDSSVVSITSGTPAARVKVSTDTLLLTEGTTDCSKSPLSCVQIKKSGSIHVKALDNNQMKITRFKDMPMLSVDLIKDDSSVDFIERKKNGRIGVSITKKGLTAYPPSSLPGLETMIAFQKVGKDKKVKTMVVDPLNKNFVTIDENSGKRSISGYMDSWVARNYYSTSYGGLIPSEKQKEFDKRLKMLFGDSYYTYSQARLDLFYIIMSKNPNIENVDLEMIYESLSNTKMNKKLSQEEFRKLINIFSGNADVEETSEFSEISELLKKDGKGLLYARLLEMYSKGELSKAAFGSLTSRLGETDPSLFSKPEDVSRYLELLKKLPSEKEGFEGEFANKVNILAGIYKRYHQGDNKNNDFYDAMEQLAATGRISNPKGLKLPGYLYGESLPHFVKFAENADYFYPLNDAKLDDLIVLYAEESSLASEISTYINVANQKDSNYNFLKYANEIYDQNRAVGIDIMEKLRRASVNPKLSAETRNNLKFEYRHLRTELYFAVSTWDPQNDGDVTSFVRSLPSEIRKDILKIVGSENSLISKSEVEKDLKKLAKEYLPPPPPPPPSNNQPNEKISLSNIDKSTIAGETGQ